MIFILNNLFENREIKMISHSIFNWHQHLFVLLISKIDFPRIINTLCKKFKTFIIFELKYFQFCLLFLHSKFSMLSNLLLMRIETEMIVDNFDLKETYHNFKNPWESLKFEEISLYLLYCINNIILIPTFIQWLKFMEQSYAMYHNL